MGRELPTNLVRRRSRIWVRIEVPKDVRAVYGKAVVFESTKHDDDRKGRAAGLARLAELQAEWGRIRERGRPMPLAPSTLQRAAYDLHVRELAEDDARRLSLPTTDQLEQMRAASAKSRDRVSAAFDYLAARGAGDYDRKRRAALLQELRKHLGSGETALVADQADDVVKREGLNAPRDSLPWRELCRDLQRAWITALEVQAARDAGDYTAAPRDPIVAEPATATGETVMELYDLLTKLNPDNLKADTLRYGRPIIQLFADTLPAGAPASAITKKAVVAWFDDLARYPKKAGDMMMFRGMSFREVIDHNATLPEPKPAISRRTANKYLASLGGFCSWLVKRDVLQTNPTTGLGFSDEENTPRRPYTVPELRSIFASPVYTGFKADRREHLPGELRTRDWRFWLPLLGLYTGARLGELAQLLTADVREEDGSWVIYVTAEGDDGKSLKTAGSRRVIPIHAELTRIGFLDYYGAMQARGERRLWPEIALCANDRETNSTWKSTLEGVRIRSCRCPP